MHYYGDTGGVLNDMPYVNNQLKVDGVGGIALCRTVSCRTEKNPGRTHRPHAAVDGVLVTLLLADGGRSW